MTELVDAVLGRPDGEAARRADRILALAGLLGQIALAGVPEPGVRRAGRGARRPARRRRGARRRRRARRRRLGLRAARRTRSCARGWTRSRSPRSRSSPALALEGAALTARSPPRRSRSPALARRHDDRYAAWAAVGFAALGLVHALGTLAPPDALLDGLDPPLAAAGALAAVAAALFAVSRAPLAIQDARRYLATAAALTLLYLASVEVVTAAGPEHTGQTLLSVLWALAGVGALVRGLLIDDRALRQRRARRCSASTIGKVFLYDMASLDSLYRVGSLIGLGLLLLCGAFAWQRVRPRARTVG